MKMDVMLCFQYNDDALVEMLKHLDAQSLAIVACVNK